MTLESGGSGRCAVGVIMRLRTLFVFFLAGLVGFALAQSRYVEGEVLVKFKAGYEVAAQAANVSIGARVTGGVPDIGVTKVKLPPYVSVPAAVRMYRSKSYVEYAEPNGIWDLHFTPNDPLFAQQWQHPNVRTPLAWDINQGSSTVVIAILDTGVEAAHPDLSSKLVPGWDFINNDPIPEDNAGHGTHVAGLAAAATNNAIGVAGTGFNCRIMPVKVCEVFCPWDVVANGITFAANNGARVINMSLGGSSPSTVLENAVNYAWGRNVVILASAGNSGGTGLLYPAAYANVIAVASNNQDDSRSSFSTYGSWVEVTAPGNNVLSTIPGGYGNNSGTSMSSPVAAGVVGLIWSVSGSSAVNSAIRNTLETTCDPVPGNYVMRGRINAQRALLNAPIFVDVPLNATDAWARVGGFQFGGAKSLHFRDNDFFIVESEPVPGLGQIAEIQATYRATMAASSIVTLTAEVNAQAVSGATGFLYAYRWSQNQFVWLKSFPMTGSSAPSTVSVTLPQPYSNWINGSGDIQLVVRSLGARRQPLIYDFMLDRLRLIARVRQ